MEGRKKSDNRPSPLGHGKRRARTPSYNGDIQAGANSPPPSLPPSTHHSISASRTLRLQKFLARAGVASRRACEELIRQGRVEVNGQRADIGCRVDPHRDRVMLDARPVSVERRMVYLALNKPRNCVTTARDPQGRKTVVQLVSEVDARVFPVGRLDFDAEGLLLLTNDGELANRLLHPRYGISKTYEVKITGHPGENALERLRSGVVLEEGKTAPAEVTILRESAAGTWLRITLHQGWNRQLKRMGEAVGHLVTRIRRVAYGPVKLGKLGTGQYRTLREDEIRRIYQQAGLDKESTGI